MNITLKRMTLIALPLFLTACGGGGGGDTSTGSGGSGSSDVSSSSPTTSLVNTEDIVAARAFKFCIGDAIQLSVNYSGSTPGALHVYSQADYVHANGDVDVDPLSRLTTIYPDLTTTVDIEINGNWEQIYARWVPMSSSELEQTFVVTLNQASGAYVISF
ncbi:hypothetical protein D515_04321 [Grimontia indica]|uniref:Lipoprotein n=1 Tax=Grimontia indica TaxID=1056512 RepID=R1GZA3_9GAMM|nr:MULTISPECIES: hypothetical protein [Grimontia]EOD81419.1 hypothetical protein D515_04321 [Grimontia indica]